MKKYIFPSIFKSLLLLTTLLNFILTSCSTDNKPKIGFLLPNMVDERTTKDRDYFIAKIKELGGEPMVVEAQYSDQLQIAQAQELISKGVKVLVVMCVNKNTAAAIVRNAHAKNIKVIAYERIISNCELDYYLSFDNIKVGELMASFAMKLKPEGKYMLLCGDKGDQNAIWVKEGQQKIISPSVNSGKIKIVYDSYVEDWSGDNAGHEFKKYLNLTNDVPDVILSSYDGMSTGVIKVLEDNAIGYPLITGQNAELEACKNIIKGKQSMTVYKSLKVEAEKAAEIAMKCARNETISVQKTVSNGTTNVPSILIDPVSIDVTNMKSTIIADGFLKEQDVYGN
jgi:D-xylose transport system substrate-binding protein